MNRRDFIQALSSTTLGAALTSRVATGAPPGRDRRPNVVLILTDDQGYGDLSCHGNPVLRTPHLDALYSASARLTDFHVDAVCAPTRAALLTGRYSSRVGVWHTIMGRSLLWQDEVTMADVFRHNGYRTGIFGKWHLGDNRPYRPEDRGFDEVLVLGGGAIGNTPDHWGNDYFDDTYCHNGQWKRFPGYCTDVFFDRAIDFIRRCGDQPFFAYVATNTPHWPHQVAEEYAAPYRGKVPDRRATFYGMIANIDSNVGRLRRFLREAGLEDNTILIFMTDNGTSFGAEFDEREHVKEGYNAGMRGCKGSVLDGGHRVPCFLRWPRGGIGGGVDVPELAAHIDLLPTLIDLCALRTPDGPGLDGRSLRAALTGSGQPLDPRVLLVHNQRVDLPIKGKDFAVMTPQWRLVRQALYDIRRDPGQREDLSTRRPDVVDVLSDAYERWWTEISAHFDDYPTIPVGTSYDEVVPLTSHDVHGQVVWDQSQVRRNARCDGFWAIDVAARGLYEVELRRWPIEADLAITSAPAGATAMKATHARLRVGSADLIRPLREGDKAARFEVRLDRQKTRLQGWFVDGRENGAVNCPFYAYLRRR